MTLSLVETLESLVGALRQLSAVLDSEYDALGANDYAALCQASATKGQVLKDVQHLTLAIGDQHLSEQISQAPDIEQEKLSTLHKTTKLLALNAKNQNLVNGKIIQRSQQSARELVSLMYGTDSEMLYSQNGQSNANCSSGAIAKA